MSSKKLTEKIWNDFLDTAVDASGAAGWKWFYDKYRFTEESLTQTILSNQEKAEKYDDMLKNGLMFIDRDWVKDQISILLGHEKENKQLKKENDSLGSELQEATHREKKLKEIVDRLKEWKSLLEQDEEVHEDMLWHEWDISTKLKEILNGEENHG